MNDTFRVVRNDEEQYSIMPSDMMNPPGWHDEGTVGTRAACLARIGEVWTDLRPRSLRESVTARTA
ncbi:MbtH family NRPS accessory protein [Dactylosporangium sp. NPDC050688]|uniref:MbtH family protein n=1 Tax=Dactylosporangium sp. NPDC050688 TaxID=3157217 RepID=UPI003408AF37